MRFSDTEQYIKWFLSSPIYAGNGEYRAFYSNKGDVGPFYPEITAYAISLCLAIYGDFKEDVFLERARECASRLINTNKGGLPSYFDDGLLYTFDTGMYISALLGLWKETLDEVYRLEAEKALKWLLSLFDGEKFAAVDCSIKETDWPYVPSVHLAKLVMPLVKAWALLGKEKYRKVATCLLSWAKELQLASGRFQTNCYSNETVTHSHCYAVEGFLFAYYYLKDDGLLEVAKKGINWLSSVQNRDGSFCHHYPKRTLEGFFYMRNVTDATAQAIRLWKLLGVNKEGIARGYQFLKHCESDDGLKHSGRYCLGIPLPAEKNVVYSWPTFFYMHSLLLPFGRFDYVRELF